MDKPAWVKDAVFYQIFPDRFFNGDKSNDPEGTVSWGEIPTRENFMGGDIHGIFQKLDYLQDLGVNAIYLNPVFKARTNHRYDTCDYYQIDPALGDLALMKAFVKDLHRRDMHIILDGVFNHCGDGFPQFLDVWEKGEKSPYADWFLFNELPLRKDPINFLSCGGCTYLPKLNHKNPEVKKFILDVGRYWLKELDLDGWRLDVPFKISPDFWEEFRNAVKAVNPQAYLVGEVWREAGPWIKGDTFDGITNYRLRDIIFDYVQTCILDGEDFGYELQTLLSSFGEAAGCMLNLLDSHDTPRILTSFKGNISLLHIALTIQMTLPGAPMLYYGDEVGLLGETDPDCRRCFPWKEADQNQQVLKKFKTLIHLRRNHPCFRYGSPQTLAYFNGVYVYRQAYKEDEAIVILNPREGISNLRIPTLSQIKSWQNIETREGFYTRDGVLDMPYIPPESAVVLLPG